MFYLQKILLALLSPISIAILFLTFTTYKRKWLASYFFIAFLAIFSLPFTSKHLIEFIEKDNIKPSLIKLDNAQAIVVLSGYLSVINVPGAKQFQWGSADRFFNGINLASHDKSKFLVFTNERLPWNGDDAPDTGKFLANQAQKLGIIKEQILITEPVQNTQEEAIAVAKLAKEKGFSSITLVTSAFHMQRAQLLFEKVGLTVIPYPTDFHTTAHYYSILDFMPSASALQLSELVIREMIGRLYYRYLY